MIRKAPSRQALLPFALSLAAALAFFRLWPTRLVWDDTGISLKYMDNFAAGHFYCYNPGDGPVFGVSGFLHGILAGALARLHVLSPLDCLLASNFLGLVLLSYLTLRILALHTTHRLLIYPAWLLLLASCPHLVVNLKQGLETPLHLAVILAAVFFFLTRRGRAFWATGALAIVSKLDAVPIIAVLGALEVAPALLAHDRGRLRATAREMLLWFAAPLAVWLIFATVAFGSPVPHTALAKLSYHPHAAGSWFPFLLGFKMPARFSLLLLALLVLFLAQHLVRRRRLEARQIVCLLAALAYLVPYYLYNPGERMGWYYAVPEYLFLLQALVFTFGIGERLRPVAALAFGTTVIVALGLARIPQALGEARHTVGYLRQCESERIAGGRWIRENSAPGDTLMTRFGHVARESGLYTVDASGLCSDTAIARRLDFRRLVLDLRPDWIYRHGLMGPDLQQRDGYRLVKSYYNIAAFHGWPAFRIYRKSADPTLVVCEPLKAEGIHSDGAVRTMAEGAYLTAEGTRLILEIAATDGAPKGLIMGLVRREDDLQLTAEMVDGAGATLARAEHSLARRDPSDDLGGLTDEWRLEFPPGRPPDRVEISARRADCSEVGQITLIEPLVVSIGRN